MWPASDVLWPRHREPEPAGCWSVLVVPYRPQWILPLNFIIVMDLRALVIFFFLFSFSGSCSMPIIWMKEGSASPLWWRCNSFGITVWKGVLMADRNCWLQLTVSTIWVDALCVQSWLAVTGWEQTDRPGCSFLSSWCLALAEWESARGRYGWRGGIKNNQKVDSGLG